jgi:hypothetical protein
MKNRVSFLAGISLASVALVFALNRIQPTVEAGKAEARKRRPAAEAGPAFEVVPLHGSRQSAGGSGSSGAALPLGAYMLEAKRLKACYAGGCAYPETDPRAYDFALGQDLRNTLLGMAKVALEQSVASEELSAIGREYLDNLDGHVQEAALALLATQPTSRENLQAILQFVIGGFDAQLVPLALRELARYGQQAEMELIDNAFAQAMLTGAPFVANLLSRGILPFLHDGNLRFYRELDERLPVGSVFRANLENALRAYQQSG